MKFNPNDIVRRNILERKQASIAYYRMTNGDNQIKYSIVSEKEMCL